MTAISGASFLGELRFFTSVPRPGLRQKLISERVVLKTRKKVGEEGVLSINRVCGKSGFIYINFIHINKLRVRNMKLALAKG